MLCKWRVKNADAFPKIGCGSAMPNENFRFPLALHSPFTIFAAD